MQVLNTGTTYRIFDESMKAYNELPAGVYKINFHPQMGYSLIKSENIEITEKIYGNHIEKVNKVYKSFELFDRNLGIILSGAKGIGKSLFAKLLAQKATENGYPIIICDTPYPGIADFLGSIQQEIVVLFDEFDKTFKEREDFEPQGDMLTLFDGLYSGKKMFVITCNEIKKLNDYLVNRPGRFHYHFRFSYPKADEITAYLKDHVIEKYWDEITNVVNFSNKVDLNYDCLRAIAFELNLGINFKDCISDLNIMNIDVYSYDLMLCFKDGTYYKYRGLSLDLFEDSDISEILWMNNGDKTPAIKIEFYPSDHEFDPQKGLVIPGGLIKIVGFDYQEWDLEEEEVQKLKDKASQLEKIGISHLSLTRHHTRELHYAI